MRGENVSGGEGMTVRVEGTVGEDDVVGVESGKD
jgi:hypothetical protein